MIPDRQQKCCLLTPDLEPLKTRCIPNLESVVPDLTGTLQSVFSVKSKQMLFVILPNILFKGMPIVKI